MLKQILVTMAAMATVLVVSAMAGAAEPQSDPSNAPHLDMGNATQVAAKFFYPGEDGDVPGRGKQIVLISGDEEYRSEEACVCLAEILAKHHGFYCTVLFAIDPKTNEIDPVINDNIPGMEALKAADLCIIATRFRNLPDEQMQYFADYVNRGGAFIGLRTATHGFNIPDDRKFAEYSWNASKESGWDGGFGRQVLGETWIAHHGNHGVEATRGIVAPGQEKNSLVRGCEDIFGPTDVYTVRLPLPGDSTPIFLGEVLTGMNPTDPPVQNEKNDPMMPIAWTKTYQSPADASKTGRVFTTTMGAATDLPSEGVRRMIVNGVYWCIGIEDQIPEAGTNVELTGPFKPTHFGFGKHIPGKKPVDYMSEQ